MTRPYASGKRWTLYAGDCLDVLRGMEVGGIDAVVTDPPWGLSGGRGSDARENGKAVYAGDWLDDEDYIATVVVPVVSALIDTRVPMAVTPGVRCMYLYPRPRDVGCFWQPAAATHGPWGFTTFNPILFYGQDWRAGKGALPTGIRVVKAAERSSHPCAKPLDPWVWLVDKVAPPDNTALDPFAGSGTTGVACLETGRRFIGIEREPAYLDIAAKRLEQAESDGVQQGLFTHTERP